MGELKRSDVVWRRTATGQMLHAVLVQGRAGGSGTACAVGLWRPWSEWHADDSKPKHDACARRVEPVPNEENTNA